MKPRVVLLRPLALSAYEMAYFEPLLGEFDVEAFIQRPFPIGGPPAAIPVRRLRWADEEVWEALLGRPASVLNAFWARALGRRYRLPGLARALAEPRPAAIVHALETRGEASYQAARLKDRLGFRFVLACSENVPAGADEPPGARRRRLAVQAAADRFLAISEAARAALEADGADPARVEVIGHGIDLERFRPAPRPAAGPPTVLFVGRLSREKGPDVLLEAWRRLGRPPAEARLVAVGDGPERAALERGAPVGVEFVGEVPYAEVDRFYRAADVVAVPSVPTPGLVEQWGFAAAEAMASGVPVVASDLPGPREVVGDAGLLVPPGDAEALERALGALLDDPARRSDLGRRGRARAEARFDRRAVARRLAEVYRGLLAGVREA